MADFHIEGLDEGFGAETIDEIYISGILLRSDNVDASPMIAYSWENWETPTYHERLKQSYGILRDAFAELE